MKKSLIIMMVSFVNLQASDERPESRGYDLELVAIHAERQFEKNRNALLTFRESPQARAVFHAIENGFDHDFVQQIVNKALSHSPSPIATKRFQDDVTSAFKSDSVLVRNIHKDMSYGKIKMLVLEELLERIENLPTVYDNCLSSQKQLEAIEQNYKSYAQQKKH